MFLSRWYHCVRGSVDSDYGYLSIDYDYILQFTTLWLNTSQHYSRTLRHDHSQFIIRTKKILGEILTLIYLIFILSLPPWLGSWRKFFRLQLFSTFWHSCFSVTLPLNVSYGKRQLVLFYNKGTIVRGGHQNFQSFMHSVNYDHSHGI